MIEVQVRLYSILRELLPPGSKGSTKLWMPEEATIADLLSHLRIDRPVVVVVNKARVRDRKQILHSGDSVAIFPPVAGGDLLYSSNTASLWQDSRRMTLVVPRPRGMDAVAPPRVVEMRLAQRRE